MPNLGGRWITEEDIQGLIGLEGQARQDAYSKIVRFILDNFDSTAAMLSLRFGKPSDAEL